MEIHLNLSIQKRKFIKIYISNELETFIRSPVHKSISFLCYQCGYKDKQIVNLKKHKDTVHKSRKCIQNVVLKIGNALIYLFPLSEFDWIKCTQFQGKIGNSFKFQFLFSEFH